LLLGATPTLKEKPMRAQISVLRPGNMQTTTEARRLCKPVRFAAVAARAVACLLLVAGANIAHADDVDKPGDFLGSAIQDGRAEIQSCQLALRTSSDASVQAFAKRMIADHKSLDARIESLAQRKGYSLPSGISITQKATQAALKPLTGHTFDKVFMGHNVSDHKDDIKRFSEQAQQGSDPDVRALAASAVPVLREHLKLAEQTRAKVSR
jgi:putative membrane protein